MRKDYFLWKHPNETTRLAARVLVHYAIHGSIRNTADNFKLAPKTVQRYKQALFQDDELTTAYLDLLEEVKTTEWVEQLNQSMGHNNQRHERTRADT